MTYDSDENCLNGDRSRLDNDNSSLPVLRPSDEAVDSLADELAVEYDNLNYRVWYCKLIYVFGIEKVRLWQQKARNGDSPGKLFGYFARKATNNEVATGDNVAAVTNNAGGDTIVPVRGDETDAELFANIDKVFGTGN